MVEATSSSRVVTKTVAPFAPLANRNIPSKCFHFSWSSFHTSSRTSKYLLLCNTSSTFFRIVSKVWRLGFCPVAYSMMDCSIAFTLKSTETYTQIVKSKFSHTLWSWKTCLARVVLPSPPIPTME
ncbi:hypothetical protein VIGAN_10124400 [Vigna angularis var. angularis]|uniref:Uncharacterized protein n=1 Tax=Vigna angularis var. angularis TaxID=157739 RepID=A0A0S3T3L2_PHAAN|nr:hypothetical protein VIGAN_10124400 [Vigna angularis var. angularis]